MKKQNSESTYSSLLLKFDDELSIFIKEEKQHVSKEQPYAGTSGGGGGGGGGGGHA